MTDLVVHPVNRPLLGTVRVPSDKSVAHRALVFGAIADGRSTLRGASLGLDNASTASALRSLGVRVEKCHHKTIQIDGVGLRGLRAPRAPLDCGNSGTTMRLLAGVLAAQPFASILFGDESLSGRPMSRIADPLRARGANITGRPHPQKPGEITAPLAIEPLAAGRALAGMSHESRVPSAQVKSALLLSGLYAEGVTRVLEPSRSRDHTERMLRSLGVPIVERDGVLELDPATWDKRVAPFAIDLPGDPSSAAFLLVAAHVVAASRVTVRGVGVNPTRTGLFDVARAMGAGLVEERSHDPAGEPIADLTGWSAPLRATRIAGGIVARAIDELPIACALAARAAGRTTIADAGELRVKESDRIAAMIGVLRAFGVDCEEHSDGMTIEGTDAPLRGTDVTSNGDHRVAMTACILALLADGPSRIRDADCIDTSFPTFLSTLCGLGADIRQA